MSTTLTNGLKLPDKGSVDWYADMQSNYTILDGAVGTIAAHTAALAGKAPLVHTHTKSDITDFPAYGTTAGTICEGNDSRLSDARTPVAHTHTKSDVTDLLNSNFIPSANNSYDLGSSSYQWSNLYAKGYYYNGVAWGLDKANTWSGCNKFTGITELSTTAEGVELFHNTWHGYEQYYTRGTSNYPNYDTFLKWNSTRYDNTLGLFKSVGVLTSTTEGATVNDIDETFAYYIYHINAKYVDFMNNVRIVNDGTYDILAPISNGTTNLGTSTNKWKTLWANGINSVPTDTVEWHNSHYRGINLISDGHFANMAALLTAIRAQDWSDIYIGDYVELTFTYEGASRTVKFYVGEIDKFYNVGDTALTTHHLVMVTGNLGINQVMNDTNTTAGGYVGSKAHTVTLPALYAILNPLFNNAILTHREHLSNTVLSAQTVSLSLDDGNGAVTYSCNNFPVYSNGDPNTPGCVTAGAWYDCNLVLMSAIEMFGSNRFSSSGIDDIMCPEGQIAALKYNRNLQTLNRTINTWLRNVNSASRFCYCHNNGASVRNAASRTDIRLRPRFLIG